MISLALRKKLLLAQSEVNREQFVVECRHLTSEISQLRGRLDKARSVMVSAASAGIAGAKAIGEMRQIYSKERGSWLSALFSSLRAGTALWKSIRSRSGN